MNYKKFRTNLFIFLLPFFLLGCTSNSPQQEKPSAETETHTHHSDTIHIGIVKPEDLIILKGETEFEVSIKESDSPLTDANVSIEYWQEGKIEHQFVEASESPAGQYSALVQFQQPGYFIIKVHLEKGEIHEHKEWMMTVE